MSGKTDDDLTQALVALIGEVPWPRVTVAALCRRARVHRATFYTHFEDRDDLLVRSLPRLFDSLAAEAGPGATLRAHLERVFVHCAGHRAFYRAALTPGHPARNVLENYLIVHARTEAARPQSELAARAGASALLAAVEWFAADPGLTEAEAAAQLDRLVSQGWS